MIYDVAYGKAYWKKCIESTWTYYERTFLFYVCVFWAYLASVLYIIDKVISCFYR